MNATTTTRTRKKRPDKRPTLVRALHRIHHAVSADETRSNLQSVLLEATGDGLCLTATDGHRLSSTTVPRVAVEECIQYARAHLKRPCGIFSLLERADFKRAMPAKPRVLQRMTTFGDLTSWLTTGHGEEEPAFPAHYRQTFGSTN